MLASLRARAVIGLGLTAVVAVGPAFAAVAASAPRWRVVYQHHFGPRAAGRHSSVSPWRATGRSGLSVISS